MLPKLQDIDMQGKRVLLRAGFDVPMKNGTILNDRRIQSTLPTIRAILNAGAKQLVIVSHEGRPKGKVVPELSLKPVATDLAQHLGEKVAFLPESIGVKMPAVRIVLLENLRFHSEEKQNDPKFAKQLASYGDVFVEDAFSNLHREDASIVGLPKLFKAKAIGALVETELQALDFTNPEQPFIALIGSAKVSGKIELLEALLKKADRLLLGGGIVFTFLKAKGFEVGGSLCEDGEIPIAKDLLDRFGTKIILPSDIVVADGLEALEIHTVAADKIPANLKGLDIGDRTVEEYRQILDTAKTVFWNGPLGVFEVPPFDHATKEIASHLAKLKARIVVGGGDTSEAVDAMGYSRYYSHVSTGGGASLQLVAGLPMPGLEAMRN